MLLALIAATQIAYAFPADVVRTYDMRVTFDGYLPLLGGKEAKAEVAMVVEVRGGVPDEKGQPTVTSEIKDLKLTLNGATMPFNASNIQTHFPKTTISMTPQGKMLKTNAPETPFPFRLPGLDVKRFPDISYLPLEFPVEGVELSKSWSFKKLFGSADMTYAVTPTAIDDKKAAFKIGLDQKETLFEDAQKSLVAENAATHRIESQLTGDGSATFDRTLSLVSDYVGRAESVSKVTEIKTGKQTERRLKLSISVKLKQP